MEQQLEQFNFAHRLYNPITYTAYSQENAVQIDRLNGIRALVLHAYGTFTVASGTATAITTAPQFLKDIRLTVGGGTVLFAGSGDDLYRINQLNEYGVAPYYSNLVSGGAGTYAFSTVLMINLQEVMSKVPIDTALISRLFSSIELRVRIGDATDLQTGGTVNFTSFQVEATSLDVVNMKDGFGRFVKKVSFVERELTSTQTEFIIPLPTGNLIKKIHLRAFAAGVLNDSVINNVKVLVGGDVVFDMRKDALRGYNVLKQLMNATPSGFYEIDFNPDSILSEGLNLSKVASLGCNLVLDCTKQTGTNLIRAYVTEVLPLR